MLRSFHAERIVSRRTAIISAGIMAAFTALLTSLLFIGTDDVAPGSGPGAPGVSVDLNTAEGIIQGLASGATMIGIVALAVFAISVAKDYERGTIRQLLVGEPRRAVLLGGKLLALVAVTVAGVALAAAVGSAQPSLSQAPGASPLRPGRRARASLPSPRPRSTWPWQQSCGVSQEQPWQWPLGRPLLPSLAESLTCSSVRTC